MRIGLHTGQAIKDADRFFGLTVILAARIAAQARAGEVLVSAQLRQIIAKTVEISVGEERVVELKGISEPQHLFPLRWERT